MYYTTYIVLSTAALSSSLSAAPGLPIPTVHGMLLWRRLRAGRITTRLIGALRPLSLPPALVRLQQRFHARQLLRLGCREIDTLIWVSFDVKQGEGSTDVRALPTHCGVGAGPHRAWPLGKDFGAALDIVSIDAARRRGNGAAEHRKSHDRIAG